MAAIICLWVYQHINDDNPRQFDSALPISQLPVSTRIVKHVGGETKIPIKPQRIITLHDATILDPVLALGVKPIGIATYAPEQGVLFRGIHEAQVRNIQQVGSAFQPSLEKILMLKPDLILGREYQKNIYNQLSKFAPTVLVDWGSFNHFQDNLRYIAQVLGKEEKAKYVLNQYQERIQYFKILMGNRLQKIEVSVIGFSGQNIKSLNHDAVFNQVLDDAGVKRLSIQKNQEERFLQLSLEDLNKYDADVLFIINESPDNDTSYLQSPLWQHLKAVKNQQVYIVNQSDWLAGGPLGANKILDDLFKYLVK
ncbi:iron-siderophore ABC transporter substrate-binding protein [Anabaena sp. UHCC 0399]|uniref:iron-siderophore ABC transporter substrate-binding protein n=1 Tax=Anabaena sp. UHCC 0399 TaxID=3110238 RepID=UPI002B1FB1E9|nr:iron-siderophore ABC transporter substrate-binding protein [Anabaena sp. UHCC 0399]MEA5569267.1 iron-siderophore ABC transporter substrate-binding protein [Anabaena sp. UHCC 0399]